MTPPAGRHFLQIPGPTNVPDRVLSAIAGPTIDHRGPDFSKLALEVLAGLKGVFKTESNVLVFPGSGTGAWEAALVNTLSPGDRILMYETGQFATLWCAMARKLGIEVDFISGDWLAGEPSLRLRTRLSGPYLGLPDTHAFVFHLEGMRCRHPTQRWSPPTCNPRR